MFLISWLTSNSFIHQVSSAHQIISKMSCFQHFNRIELIFNQLKDCFFYGILRIMLGKKLSTQKRFLNKHEIFDYLMFLCWWNRRKLINTLGKHSKERKITKEKHIKEANSSVNTIRIHEHCFISMENTIATIWIIYIRCLISCHLSKYQLKFCHFHWIPHEFIS